MVTNIPQNKF